MTTDLAVARKFKENQRGMCGKYGLVPCQPAIDMGVTTAWSSSGAPHLTIESSILTLHMEFPEVVPLSIEVSRLEVEHCLGT